MVGREIQKASVSECSWKEGFVTGSEFQVSTKPVVGSSPVVFLKGESIRLGSTTHRKRFSWKSEEHFHSKLLIPSSSSAGADGVGNPATLSHTGNRLLLMFEAQAKENLSIAISPEIDGVHNIGHQICYYEIVLGSSGNTCTILRRCSRQKRNRIDSTIPSRPCHASAWTSYWVCITPTTTNTNAEGSSSSDDHTISVGVGSIPGEQCIGILHAPWKAAAQQQQQQSTEKPMPDATNSTTATKSDDAVEETEAAVVSNVNSNNNGDDSSTPVESKEPEETANNNNDTMDTTTDANPHPALHYVGFANSSKAANAQPVLLQKVVLTTMIPPQVEEKITALSAQDDLPLVVMDGNTEWIELMKEYKKECAIRKTRAEKYGTAYKEPDRYAFIPWSKAKRMRENPEKGFSTGFDLMDPEEVKKKEARRTRFGKNEGGDGDNATTGDDLLMATDSNTVSEGQDLPLIQAWDKEAMLRPQRKDPPVALWKQAPESATEQRDSFAMEEEVTWVPEKLHLFSIDWAAFKQIRNKDIMSYFSIYGPSYVEWLGDLSCNVCFEDRFSASRAMLGVSQELPSPCPEEVAARGETDSASPDFGNMNWRFCTGAMRKVSNDRFGKRGTTARVLIRLATTCDILDERPNEWPAPPGGFSSTKVLGPDSDYPPTKGQKGKKKRGHGNPQRNEEQRDAYVPGSGEDHPMLSRGLSSGRGGFSVEALEAERAVKKAKTVDQ